MLAGAPQLLTMSSESVRGRHELLARLAQATPGWATQLGAAAPPVLGAWLAGRCGWQGGLAGSML